MSEIITALVTSRVLGPKGQKLVVGRIIELEDDPYVRLLLKSGALELIDPPSLDYIDKPKKPTFMAPEIKETEVSDGIKDNPQSGRYPEVTSRPDSDKGPGKKSGQRSTASPIDSSEG